MKLLFGAAWRWLVMVLLVLLVLAFITATAPRVFSSDTVCVSSKDRIVGLYSTNLDVTVAKMHRVQSKCYGPRHWLRSTRTRVWFVKTGWGQFFGTKFDVGPPVPVYADKGVVRWQQDYSMIECFAYYAPFCGAQLDFRWRTDIYAPRLRHGFVWWGPFCTNSACKAGTPDKLEFRE
jgi:hypothetical protein